MRPLPHLNHTLERASLETIHQAELSELTLKSPHMEALIELAKTRNSLKRELNNQHTLLLRQQQYIMLNSVQSN